MLSSKSISILQHLLENPNPIALTTVSSVLTMGERTIRYEIDKINDFLKTNSLKNITIKKSQVIIEDFQSISLLVKENIGEYFLSSKEREIKILLNIFLDRRIKQSDLLNDLDTSKSTLKSHLKYIREFLDKYNLSLELEHKKGLILIGEEENIRKALLKVTMDISKENSLVLKNALEEIFDGINDASICTFINFCQKQMKKIISDEAFEIIKNYLLIAIIMNKKGYPIDKISNKKFLSETKEYEAILKSNSIIEANYDIEFSQIEYLTIADYFLGSHTYNFNSSYYNNWVEIEFIVKEMINDFNKKIHSDISEDTLLMEGLLNHIKPTIYRIKNNIDLGNSIYQEIIENYPELYQLTSEVVNRLENYIGSKFSQDEIAFLVIHFKSSLDRSIKLTPKLRALVVCGSGFGTSQLLAQQLKSRYDINIIETIPKYLLEKSLEKNSIDYIFSTVNINNSKITTPIVKLNPFLLKEDLEIIESLKIPYNERKIRLSSLLEIITLHSEVANLEELKKDLRNNFEELLVDDVSLKKITIFDLIKENRVLIKQNILNWKEVVNLSGELLEKDGCIESSYTKEMIDIIDEHGGYMILAPGIAFPHATTRNNVKKTGISIVTLNKPISLGKTGEADIFISICSKDGVEHKEAFMKIVEQVNQKEFREKLNKIKTSKDFINKIFID